MKARMKPHRPLVHWLVVRGESDTVVRSSDAYLVNIFSGDSALAVFSFREEAQMFVEAFQAQCGWYSVEITDEALLKWFHEDRSSIAFVALDPLPINLAPGLIDLVCIDRDHFLHYLTCRDQRNNATSLSGFKKPPAESPVICLDEYRRFDEE